MRSRPQHDALRRAVFFASRHSWSRKICINLLLARNRADQVSKSLRRLSLAVHFAFISLNAG
jgi:hypothetical protein